MKKNFFLSAVLALTCSLFSNLISSQNTYQSYGGLFEQVYDADGNAYTLEEVKTDSTKLSTRGSTLLAPCDTSGYFIAQYDSSSGFELINDPVHQMRREVLCHVLSALSKYIIPVNPNQKVYIRVRDMLAMGFPPSQMDNTLAVASPFYAYPQPLSGVGGILDNLVWKTINSGQDAYQDITGMVLPNNLAISQSFYHAQLTVNFRDEDTLSSTFNTSPIHWNNDVALSPDITQYDLYSVLLHEMLHALGFASFIRQNGTSALTPSPYFTRYDSFLEKRMGNGLYYPLISQTAEPCSMYYSAWNNAVTSNPSAVLNPICDTVHQFVTNCNSAIQFGGSSDQIVHHPGCFVFGSSLSHLSDACNDSTAIPFQHFLMAHAFEAGIMRRYMQPEERSILCDLGYHVNDYFGYADSLLSDDFVLDNEIIYSAGVCGGDQVIGFNDGFNAEGFNTLVCIDGNPITFTGDSLLGNDYAPSSAGLAFTCLELILGDGSFSINGSATATSGTSASSIQFIPAYPNGTFLLRYVPVQNGVKGNITYVFIKALSSPPDQTNHYYQYGLCNENVCNLVNNGNFEEDAEWCSHRCRNNFDRKDEIACWMPYGSPTINSAYFTRTMSVTDTIGNDSTYSCGHDENTFIRPINSFPIAGINSNTISEPASDTYDGLFSNGAFVLLGANKLQDPPIGQFQTMSGRFRTQLSGPLALGPDNRYVLSYYAKVLNSNLEDSLSNDLNAVLVAQDLYHSGNVAGKIRFLLDDLGPNDGLYLPSADSLMLNTEDIFDSIYLFAEPDSIPPVGPNPTPTSDWHYREVIFWLPASLGDNMQWLTIDYNIWDSPLENVITGVFIDDVSIRPYYGPVVNLPDTICYTSEISDMSSYISLPNTTGTYSCPLCPPGSVINDGSTFVGSVAGVGDHEIRFSYLNPAGCESVAYELVHVTDIDCCLSTVDFSMPDSLCANDSIVNLFEFVDQANVTGTFTCPDFPLSIVDTLGSIHFDAAQTSLGDVAIIFQFENENSCLISDTSVVHIYNCCVSEVTFAIPDSLCPNGVIENLYAYVSDSTVTGTFSCPDFPSSITELNDQFIFNAALTSPGDVAIIFQFTLTNGCEIFDTAFVHVRGCCNQINPIIVQSICADDEITNTISVEASDGNNTAGDTDDFTFLWTSSETFMILTTTPIISNIAFLPCGNYHLQLTDNQHGCVTDYDFTIDCLPEQPLEAEVIQHDGLCWVDEGPWLQANVGGGVEPYIFLWTNNDTDEQFFVQDLQNAQDGYYLFTATDSLGCQVHGEGYISSTANEDIYEIVAATDCQWIPGVDITFHTNTNEALVYDWDLGNGATSSDAEPTMQYDAPGEYVISLTVTTEDCGEIVFPSITISIGDFDWPNPIDIADQTDADAMLIDGNTYGGDIVFLANETHYLVEDLTLYLAPEVDIVIEEGAFVTFRNCTFTSCTNWNGIDLRSWSETPEEPAFLVLDGCSLRFAYEAVHTRDLTDAPGNNEAGIYHVENCTFLNNRISIRVDEADHPTVEISQPYILGTTHSHFLVNDDYTNHFSEPFRNMVRYNDVRYYNFTACDFENAMQNVSSWSERGEAIHGLNANFYVDDEDGPNQNVGLSRFKGFEMAIDVSILNGAYNYMMVRETDFTQNRIGIFNRNVCFQRLIKNNMIVGESTGISALDDQEIDHEGIVLDGGGFYRDSGNEIIGDQLSAANIGKTIGIRIRDNVTENQEVNNNHLFNCNYAMLPNGNNRTFDSGLRFVCNEFEDNVQDIFVGDFLGNGNIASIAQEQSDLGDLSNDDDKAAGNSFTSTPPNSNFFNDQEGEAIEYLFFDDAGGPQTPILEGNVTPNNEGAPNSCELETIDEMPVEDVLNPTVISYWTQITEALKETWNTYDYLYTATIDQGNTQALVNLIDGAWSTNVWSVRQTLLNGSPNLSEEVLLKLAFYMPDMPYLMALEIFLANPTITAQPSFNMYLKTETNMPDYMIDMIANNTNQSLSRELLEENVAKSHMRFLEAQTYLLQYNLYHNAMSSLDLIEELNKSKCLTAEWLITDMYLNQDMIQEAQDRYYETTNHLRFSKLEMGQEYYAFGEWLEVVANNSDLTRLGESDLATLENLASTSYYTTAGKKAMTLLNEHYEMDHFTPPYYQSQNTVPRSLHYDENGSVAVHLMRVFPNPANQYVQVQCELGNQFIGNEELLLLDATGKQIRVMKINQAKQSFLIDVTPYGSGQYQLLLKNGDHVLETTAISVEH